MRAETLCRNRHNADEFPCVACRAEALLYPPAPALRTEEVDGLTFAVPTWDPAPTPWCAAGSWVHEPETEARLRAAILTAVPGWETLVEAAETAVGDGSCMTFWGSHGCSLTLDHKGLHVCGTPGDLCSAGLPFGEGDTLLLWWCFSGEVGLSREVSVHHWSWFR